MKANRLRIVCGWRRACVCLVAAWCLFGAACEGAGHGQREAGELNAEGIDESKIKRGVKPEADSDAVVLETEFGRIVIELYPNVAPQMVARFKQLVRDGVYDGTAFHRIDARLGIIQGGDPNSKDADPENDGKGDSGLPDVPAELSDLKYEAGTLGAARGGVDTANSQFFITLKPQPSFDERYTIFGRVIEGLDNARVIMTAPIEVGTQDRPQSPVLITRATLAPRANFANANAAGGGR